MIARIFVLLGDDIDDQLQSNDIKVVHCTNENFEAIMRNALLFYGPNVDLIQRFLEIHLQVYFERLPGQWLVTVSQTTDYDIYLDESARESRWFCSLNYLKMDIFVVIMRIHFPDSV
ncbi:hypothetical protein Ddc_10468 [Ditylenchus destructor]|nr:hypothetical protein Ddc_10468 [Ditylenchus destructor]